MESVIVLGSWTHHLSQKFDRQVHWQKSRPAQCNGHPCISRSVDTDVECIRDIDTYIYSIIDLHEYVTTTHDTTWNLFPITLLDPLPTIEK